MIKKLIILTYYNYFIKEITLFWPISVHFKMGNKSAKKTEGIVYTSEYAIIMVSKPTLVGNINKQYYVNYNGDLYQITKYESDSGLINLNVNNKMFYVKISKKTTPSLEIFQKYYSEICKKMAVNRIGFYSSFESFANGSFDYYVYEKNGEGALIKQKTQ